MNRIDWNEMWKEKNSALRHDNSSTFWDNFAPRFRKKVINGEDSYAKQFYEFCEINKGDTLFDMGCGSGVLAIPFAKRGHHVYAADFSTQMLKFLMEGAKEEGVEDKIHPIKLDWNEDWSDKGLPICDIAFASRSMIFKDLTASLKKLESVASRRCCMAVWDTPAEGYDRYIGKALGYERPGFSHYYLIMGELMDRDLFPELTFIKAPFRLPKYDSYEEAVKTLKGGFINGLTDEQEKIFERYCKEHIIFHPHITLNPVDGFEKKSGNISGTESEIKSKNGSGNKSENESGNGSGNKSRTESAEAYWQLDHSDISTTALIRWDIANI